MDFDADRGHLFDRDHHKSAWRLAVARLLKDTSTLRAQPVGYHRAAPLTKWR